MVAACEPCMSMHLSVWPQLIEGSNVCILWAPSCLMWNCVPYTDEIANFIIYPDNCAHTRNLHTSQPSSSQGQYDPEVYREDLSTNLWLFASFHHFCPNLAQLPHMATLKPVDGQQCSSLIWAEAEAVRMVWTL